MGFPLHRSRTVGALLGVLGTAFVTGVGSTPARAAMSIYMSPEALAERAPIVVEARVLSSETGVDPRTGAIATYVTLAVETALRGAEPGQRLVIREAGGSDGRRTVEIDAVPVYRSGERVLAFLEPARDGALRTSGMFFGKFTIEDDDEGRMRWARRELDGRGTILRGPGIPEERLPLRDLEAVTAALAGTRSATPSGRSRAGAASREGSAVSSLRQRWLAVPAEYGSLRLTGAESDGQSSTERMAGDGPSSAIDPVARIDGGLTPVAAFTPASSERARWRQVDTGGTVLINVDPTGNPLGDAAAAVTEMQRAMTAWNSVPEARVQLVLGQSSLDYRATHVKSPTAVDSGTNVILFNDPYEEISDPSQCSGVLAIGGYWRTTSINSSVNGVSFYGITQSYVIFNNGFECVLGYPDDLAEVATHELGHALGFGHSSAPDAIMRPTVYRFRGPRLGDDDRDAAHCFYPHVLHLLSPNGAETLAAGSVETISWEATPESGGDPGTVDLEYSSDGGASWSTVAADEPNDGSYLWQVPESATDQARVRVIRHNRMTYAPAPFPQSCSADASDASFDVAIVTAVAGAVPQASPSAGGIAVSKFGDGTIDLSWGPSCSSTATDYVIYEGSLDQLRAGQWDHEPVTCTTMSVLGVSLFAGPGDRYFLVAPRTAEHEGTLGQTSLGSLRPQGSFECVPRETPGECGP